LILCFCILFLTVSGSSPKISEISLILISFILPVSVKKINKKIINSSKIYIDIFSR
jgi:hypothetical protein